MIALKNLINHSIARAGLNQQVSAAQAVEAAESFLNSATLPELRSAIRVVSFAQGILKIHCQHAVAAHEVKALEKGIVETVGNAVSNCHLKQVLIQITDPRHYDL